MQTSKTTPNAKQPQTASNRLNRLQTHFSIVYPYNFPFVFSQFLLHFRNLIHNHHMQSNLLRQPQTKNFNTNALGLISTEIFGTKELNEVK